MMPVRDIQIVQETAQDLHARGEVERAQALEAVLAIAASALAGQWPNTSREYLTTGQAADVLGATRQTINKWLAAGQLQGVVVGKRTLIHRDGVLARSRTSQVQPERRPRTADDIRAEREWQAFLLDGLPADKVARLEALHEQMEDGQRLSRVERSEMASLERDVTSAAAGRLEDWLERFRPTPA